MELAYGMFCHRQIAGCKFIASQAENGEEQPTLQHIVLLLQHQTQVACILRSELVFSELFACAREKATPASDFVEQRLRLGGKAFYRSFRMTKASFAELQRRIVTEYESRRDTLPDSVQKACDGIILFSRRHYFTDYLAATLYFVGHHLSPAFDALSDLFGISRSRLNICVGICLKLIRFSLSPYFLRFVDAHDALTYHRKGADGRFAELRHAVGAIDGTFIPWRGLDNWLSGQNRCYKGYFATNVLVVCDFHMRIRFALLGMEGSLSDNATFSFSRLSTLWERTFGRDSRHFLLADAGFALSPFVLTPFRGVRYHLVEWMRGNQKPNESEEIFNLRQSSLRCTVERTIGTWKAKFPILKYGFVSKLDMMKDVRVVSIASSVLWLDYWSYCCAPQLPPSTREI